MWQSIISMRAVFVMIFISFFVCVSCTKETDSEADTAYENKEISFQAIGVDGERIYQYNYDGNQGTEETINLSIELGLGSEYLTLRQLNKTLSFFNFNQGTFSLVQKDLLSNTVQSYIDFYTNSSERSIVWGINNDDSVFFGHYNPEGSTNLAIQNISLNDFQGSDLSLEFNIEQLYQPLYHDGNLFITYKNNKSEYKISVYDTETFTLIQTISYGSVSPSILIDDNGDLAVFKFDNSSNVNLEIRDLENLSIIEELDFELNQRFSTGPLNAELKDKKLFYEYEYSQPFSLSTGPAVLDLITGENKIFDLLGIIGEIEVSDEISLYIVWQQYNAEQDSFLISYGTYNDANLLEGGILIISHSGVLVKNISLPFIPSYFVK